MRQCPPREMSVIQAADHRVQADLDQLRALPTAHGRTVALFECTLRHVADSGGGLPVMLLVPVRAVSPRRDQPARAEQAR